MEASGWAPELDTEEKRMEFVRKELEERGIVIDPNNVEKNEALRTLAKLLLNSMCKSFRLDWARKKSRALQGARCAKTPTGSLTHSWKSISWQSSSTTSTTM